MSLSAIEYTADSLREEGSNEEVTECVSQLSLTAQQNQKGPLIPSPHARRATLGPSVAGRPLVTLRGALTLVDKRVGESRYHTHLEP